MIKKKKKKIEIIAGLRQSLMKWQINNFLRMLRSSGRARVSFRRCYSIPAKSCRLMRPLGVPAVIRSILACRNAVVLSEVSAIWGQSCRFYGPTCFRFRSMMTTFRHSDCRLIMVQDLSLDSSEGTGGGQGGGGGGGEEGEGGSDW